ncbi:LPXTG cell wall anchor domain-containing protein [Microbacterium sediminis]|uniref:Uncharacterized protein n=1 Tax=Microbacterium sediminis TaxID=904291 RepID=A0A1B9NI14_9MICO|nr:LPXTG cell wall anchor domain-containing protein [Microbacterium sediminis]OCG76225.1 hypothetical protein A7J15_12440 [Microbacterium sediminis]QBR73408.1 LPXTG cell wall anchor domain-containing protein [Microbacterium sediminis]
MLLLTFLVAVPTAPAAAAANLVCTAGTSYSLRQDGSLQSVTSTGAIAQIATPGSLTWTVGASTSRGVDEANGLGITADGSRAYALERWTVGTNHYVRVMVYTASTNTWAWADGTGAQGGFDTRETGGFVVAGAVDTRTGLYLFGLFSGSRFRLYSFDPATAQYRSLGSFATGMSGSINGDMAFDAQGNLYVVGSTSTATTIFSVSAEQIGAAIASPAGDQQITAARPNSGNVSSYVTSVNGIAFDQDGSILLANGSRMDRFNPSTWAWGGTVTTELARNNVTSTDLSSCATPPTLTVEKEILARADGSDQFVLSIATGSTTVTSATTTGSATGIQDVAAGPVPVSVGTTYRFTEVMAAGSATELGRYTSSWACTVVTAAGATETVATGTGTSGSLTVTTAQAGRPITCLFTNAPKPTLTVHKHVTERAAAADQFTLTAERDGQTVASATTTGSAVGLQTRAAGPVVVEPGASYTVREAMAPGSPTAIDGYDSSWTCLVTDRATGAQAPLVSGDGTDGRVDVPSDIGASAIDCTFTNAPRPTQLTVVKDVVARVDDTDQFALSLLDPAGASIGEAVTQGQDTGEQAQRIDAVTVVPGQTYAFAESMASGSASALDQYESSYRCTIAATGAVISEGDGARGTVSIPTDAIGESVTCVIVNAPAEASLVVTKTWEVNGETYPDGEQPEGIEAALLLDLGEGATQAPWGGESTGLTAGDVVRIDERTTISSSMSGCTLTRAVATGDGIDGESPVPLTVDIVAGRQTVAITNTVECVSTLSLLKVVESPSGGTAEPADWVLTAESDDGTLIEVDGDDELTEANTISVTPEADHLLGERDAAVRSYTGTYVQVAVERFTADPDEPGALADPANWTAIDGPVAVGFGEHTIVRFVNREVPLPALPLTGGAGPVWYLAIGGALIALALVLGLVLSRRRRAPGED